MKTELQFLSELIKISREGGVNMWDLTDLIHRRIEDLQLGYSDDDIEELRRKPVKCPGCGKMKPFEDMTEHGCCEPCLDKRANKFTDNFQELIALSEMVGMENDIANELKSESKQLQL